MKKILSLILLTLILNSINGQNLSGKWLLKDINIGTESVEAYPGFQLLIIDNIKADLYTDFSLSEKTLGLKIVDSQIITELNKKYGDYKLIDNNHLKLFINGKSNGKDTVFEFDFYRLLPTKTELKKKEIEKLTYIFKEDEKTNIEFKFNKELMKVETLKLLNKKEGHKMMIEQIDSTFFVSNYYSGKREASFPIKEVTAEFIKLYAIPTGPMELIAYRKK
ncbi:hypothetical protein OOZ15_08825 [Galbibacter sp. EGI 63066]|uniref:hypothetical protein n=1 Tax=Galbibacter sp. EGI 63066 TaxID=2993559 RepID=UPI00224914B3|nr:hypothetical protein [Galbibacter sp. EGI 63066]MCX2680038.1 hypothetical protein [Galbibacter sp. EGI 63066]